MKERIIRISVLSVTFLVVLVVFSRITNRGNADMTVDMGAPTLPTVSFLMEETEVNLLAGHVKEMEISAMRDTIVALSEDGSLQGKINDYDKEIVSASYEVYSLDGKEQLLKEKKLEETKKFHLKDILEKDEEGVLKITLELPEDKKVYYYTRVIQSEKLHLMDCFDFVKKLHSNILTGADTNGLKRVFESNASGDNTTLQHVNIHSDLEHVTWGSLKPEIIGQIQYDIQETKEAYTSILLRYQVKCEGDNNPEEIFDVKEFFRVSYAKDELYLLTYDRRMEEVFDATNVVLTSKGINIGLTTENMPYKVNQDGNVVAFVQNNELWCYNKNEDEFSLVFSFGDSEKEDIRNRFDKHSIRILSMEENGNVTFGVYGYMNRGIHEGESGVAVYYFNLAHNVVEEKAFIPSTQSHIMIENRLGELAYYNDNASILYLLAESDLYKLDFNTGTQSVLLENLMDGKYVSSEDGHQMAYLKSEEGRELEVINFYNDSSQIITASEGESLKPLGFVVDDFVYGVFRAADVAMGSSGEEVEPMYKIEIRNLENEIVKTYQVDGTYILDGIIEGNMITLKRAVNKNGVYSYIAEDYITNNEEKVSNVVLKSYWTNLKETQYRLVFEDGIDKKKAKLLKPKQVLFENNRTLEFEPKMSDAFFAVYGCGEMAGLYTSAGEAIRKAEEISGVVLSHGQSYIWEDGNRVAWYRNFEVPVSPVKSGESTLAASVRILLQYEGKKVDVMTEMVSKSAMTILEENLEQEVIRFQDCSVKDLFYLIDKGVPVIALTGSDSAVVLVGYDAVSATYIEVSSGAIRRRNIDAVDDMVSASGGTFIGYVK